MKLSPTWTSRAISLLPSFAISATGGFALRTRRRITGTLASWLPVKRAAKVEPLAFAEIGNRFRPLLRMGERVAVVSPLGRAPT